MKSHNRGLARRFLTLSLLLVATLLLSACGAGQIPLSGSAPVELPLEITDTAVTAGGQAAPGVTTIAVNNTGQEPRSVVLARLNTDVTIEQFSQALATDEMAAISLVTLAGGRDAPAGESSSFIADLKEGTYAVIAFPQSDQPPFITTFAVSGSPTGQVDPDAEVTVDLVDFSFVLPEDVASGEQTWQVTNTGGQWHEMVIIKPAEGFTQDQLLELFLSDQEPQGQPPFEEIASFTPISQGERGWLPLDLEPGTYMAICFLPDFASGQSHLEKGMISTFEVSQ